MSDSAPDAAFRIAPQNLAAHLAIIFEREGCSPTVARQLAENCMAAERDGAYSHGLFRLDGYVSTLRAGGWVDGYAVPKVEDAAESFVRVDAANGFTICALAQARPLATEKARRTGACVLAIRNSHHLGALSLDVEPFADEGLIALSFINSMKAVVPFGGHRAVFGTNPIAFASPRTGGAPIVVDMATSVMANGDVQIAACEGRLLPEGAGVDREGRATCEPAKILAGGALNAFGGHKGAALALMVEILCAALGGGKFSDEVDLSRHPGAATPHTGQTFLLIDPTIGARHQAAFAERVEVLVGAVRAAGQSRLPGDRRLTVRAESAASGIPLSAAMYGKLEALAGTAPRGAVPISGKAR